MSSELDPPTHREILRQEQTRVFGKVVGTRALLVPLFATVLLSLAWFQPYRWRTLIVVAVVMAASAFFVLEFGRYQKHGLEPGAITRNLVASLFGQLLVSAATGGLLSPFIYGVLPIAGVVAVFMSPRAQLWLAATQIATLFGFAWLAASALLPGFNALSSFDGSIASLPSTHYFVHATILSILIVFVSGINRAFSGVFSITLRRVFDAQQELLTSHGERLEELTTLSAEIAHELKNPLASIKGLSGLLSQNIDDPRGTERLSVLRREVDRMQSVLEEFLNFSRPLVPLSLVTADLVELAVEVVALHEGMARQRGVRLTAEGAFAKIECDPRKVKQILINLVQNALDASPEGGSVRVVVETEPDHKVQVRVLDEGNGADLELGDLFEPGITSKSGGAGVGLTIARALARQHGGELTLESRRDRGCEARFSLPSHPSPTEATPIAQALT